MENNLSLLSFVINHPFFTTLLLRVIKILQFFANRIVYTFILKLSQSLLKFQEIGAG